MTQAAILPHQRTNVGILLGLLAVLPADKYNHDKFGFRNFDLETGCAMGLAYANRDKFDLKRVETTPDNERSLFDRLLGRNKTRIVPVVADEYENTRAMERYGTHAFAEEQFGKAMWKRIFDTDAFGVSPSAVTKEMVSERLAEFA